MMNAFMPSRCMRLAAAALASVALARAGQYTIRTTAPMTLSLPSSTTAGEHYLRDGNRTWRRLSPQRKNGTLTFHIEPGDSGPSDSVLLVTDKPEWMVLEDDTPPEVTSVTANGTPVPMANGQIDLGVVSSRELTLLIACSDRHNPIDAAGLGLSLEGGDGITGMLAPENLDGANTAGVFSVHLALERPGAYQGTIRIPDRGPDRHAAVLRFSCTAIGIDVSEDKQRIRLATPAGAFEFQPDRSRQLLLPTGAWAKLTSNIDSTWLYPREFTDVSAVEPLDRGSRITVMASTQGIEGQPIEGLGRLEYTFTVREDLAGLIVETRSISLTTEPSRTSANWGWLPGSYYVTPAGKQEWQGKATNSYKTVGHVGWLWLAPTDSREQGVAWVSPQRFGESRFDTMLLYAEDKDCKLGDAVTIRFAIAPAESADDARAFAENLNEQEDIELPRP